MSDDVPPPVLLNCHKHHAGFLRDRVRRAVVGGPDRLRSLAGELVVIGTRLMDLYHGPLSPHGIAETVMAELTRSRSEASDAFREWVGESGGYRVIEFPEDASQWVLRAGGGHRFVHVHPARYSPLTVRVRAPVLATAVLALAHAGLSGGDPLSRSVVNTVRREYLGLPPVGPDPSTAGGLGAVIELLR